MAGRPTKLTPRIQKAICATIAKGNYPSVAAEFHGVAKSTFCSWMAKGRKSRSGPFREFLDAVKKAVAKAEVNSRNAIHATAKKNWHAHAMLLERKIADRWARRDRLEVAKLSDKIKALEREQRAQKSYS